MKSVLQAGWLLTVAVGNIIVLIVAEAGQLPDQVLETDINTGMSRSDERRVGKECLRRCRYRRLAYHDKKIDNRV